MSEWQPIETAPKDGTPVLLTAYGEVDEGSWCHCDIGYYGVDFWGDKSWVMARGDYWTNPSHWMALPAPPKD